MADGGSMSCRRGGGGDSTHVHPGEEECWSSGLVPAVLDAPLGEKTHPHPIAKTVASTPVPEKTASTVPDPQGPPETIQEEQVHRTGASRQDLRNSTREGAETGPKQHKTKAEGAAVH